jgi:hypothetical protein
VRAIEPHSESDPVALLVQGLVAFGSVIGRGAHYRVEASRHHGNEFVVLVGDSARARKGSSLDHVLALFERVDRDWARERVASGLSSGEGLIWRIRDGDDDQAGGETDKRLLTVEAEFASVLRVCKRPDSTLSANLRNAWDGKTLQTLSKVSPARATRPHVSIVGHITREEMLRNVEYTEVANGLLNRFLHVAVRSSKALPFGGDLEQVDLTIELGELANAASYARQAGRVGFSPSAREQWPEQYRGLRESAAGLLGDITARAEAHVVRLALLYALLDCSEAIEPEHVGAALAVWGYCERSAAWIYGRSLGDPLADELWAAISGRPRGMTRTEIRDLLGRNRRRSEVERALGLLGSAGLVTHSRRPGGGGREVECWAATNPTAAI